MSKLKSVSIHQLERYPVYLKYLNNLNQDGVRNVFSWMLSEELGISEEQVRKDFQAISTISGQTKRGRVVIQLIDDIETFLGYRDTTNAILIGAGHLGQAFLNYDGFSDLGLNILAAFDIDEKLIGKTINKKVVFSMNRIENLIPRLSVHIAIIATPAEVADNIAQRLIGLGIEAIWNFAPIHLSYPDIIVENVNLASSLAVLSHKLNIKERK
ncbi:MAG: redox-sensing transcriptional repressor Rex [Bacilli bacterium]|jgi:redox-sensing transcriptional repressor